MGKPDGMLTSMTTILATLQCNICGCTHVKNAKGLPPDRRYVVKDPLPYTDEHDVPTLPARCDNCDLDATGHCVIKLEVARG